jgi:hypothetical protein
MIKKLDYFPFKNIKREIDIGVAMFAKQKQIHCTNISLPGLFIRQQKNKYKIYRSKGSDLSSEFYLLSSLLLSRRPARVYQMQINTQERASKKKHSHSTFASRIRRR